jgi:hypothetical protein
MGLDELVFGKLQPAHFFVVQRFSYLFYLLRPFDQVVMAAAVIQIFDQSSFLFLQRFDFCRNIFELFLLLIG